MKRLLSVILAFVLLMNIFTVLASASAVKKDATYNESIRFIRAIDIMTNYTDADFEADKAVTRAEFAGVLADIVNYKGETGISKVCTMTDVDASNEYAEKIAVVTNLKYMNGNGNGEFYPNRVVTVAEAVKTVVSMAGFDLYAQKMGGYPTGYLVTADQLGIIKNVNTSADLTLKNLAKILFNLRNVFIMQPSIITDEGEVTYSLYHDGNAERFMHKYFGVSYFEGLMTSNGITGLVGDSETDRDAVKINEAEYRINDETAYAINYIGRRVAGYYKTDEETNIKELVYLYQDDDQEFLTFDIKDYGSLVGTKLTYFTDADHNEDEEIDIASVPYIILNGKAVSSLEERLITENDYGTVTLTSSTFGKVYDTIIIETYYSVYVEDFDINNNIAYFSLESPELPENQFVIDAKDKNNIIEVFDIDGNPQEFKYITPHSMIDISQNGNVYKIIVNRSAYVKDFYVASVDGNYYGDGTKEYFVSDKYLNSTKSVIKPVLGRTYNVFINSFDAIVWFEASFNSNEYAVGYITQYASNGRGLSSGFAIKLVAENGAISSYNVAKKVMFTNAVGETAKIKYNEVEAALAGYKGIVQYKLNDENEITAIMLPGTVANPAIDTVRLTCFYDNPNNAVSYRSGILGNQVGLNTNVKIFCISENLDYTDDKDKYQVYTRSILKSSGGTYRAKAYNFDSKSRSATHLVIYDNEQFNYSEEFYYVEKMIYGTDFDGEEIVTIKSYNAPTAASMPPKPVEFTVKKEIVTNVKDITAFSSLTNSSGLRHNVEAGDIIRIYKPVNEIEEVYLVYKGNKASYNAAGKLGGIAGTTGLYSTSNLKTSNPCIPGGSGEYFYGTGYVSGYIVNVKDGFITFTTQDLSVEEYDPSREDCVTGVIPFYNYSIQISTTGAKKVVSEALLSDMRGYDTVGKNCAKIFFYSSFGAVKSVYIFNNY